MRILKIVTLQLVLTLPVHAAPPPDDTRNAIDACRDGIAHGTLSSQRSLPAVFGLLSWNIRKGLDSGWKADLQSLRDSAHLIFLQEAHAGTHLEQLLTTRPFRHFVPGFSLIGRPTGVMTASAKPSAVHCSLRSREPWLGTPKGTAITLYALGERRAALLAINLHGINLSVGTRVFDEQMQALDPLLAAHTGPVVLGGDINAWSRRRLAAVDALADRHGLRRAAFQPDLRSRIVGLAMDYVYLRGLDIVLAEALPVTSSDHNPLLLKLALPAAD